MDENNIASPQAMERNSPPHAGLSETDQEGGASLDNILNGGLKNAPGKND